MADWDDEDFDVDAGFAGDTGNNDKWEGEDEEDVKDNWEDDEEEKKPPQTEEKDAKAFQVQKKKSLAERIREKEEQKKKEALEKQKLKENEEKELTPAEIQAEKARQQQIVEEADLMLAKEMFGMSTTSSQPTIDTMKPDSKEEFAEFAKLLKEKILQFEKSPHYPELLEDIFPGVSAGLEAEVLKKLGSSLTAIGNEKSKLQKAAKGKKKKKAALVGGGKSGRRDEFDDYGDEFDDFM
ncbi:eukaryotic translation initiation factor 3 subunit J-A-like [Antedon mediterranea]|uniref:eukaryotic translation initiation factor 3 subunit J-A-like n=1 Tax=Antedon mediterranea TaxID=105859 RepID=UPI003AF792E7